jgi:SAM-dependent methyltransferase
MCPLYDTLGRSYTRTRREDPRIAAAIRRALGDARTVVDVGAGAGAYEPPGVDIVAVEPSAVMREHRRAAGAPGELVDARAEALPFADGAFDAAMAILSDHHWEDRAAGLRELRRVARRRVVLFNADPAQIDRFWLTHEYLPCFLGLVPPAYRRAGRWERELAELLGGDVRFEPVPLPHDCRDGFYGAYWRRPEAYLDPDVRAGISLFGRVPEAEWGPGIARLAHDLESGAWARAHGDLLALDELDLGYRVVVAGVS